MYDATPFPGSSATAATPVLLAEARALLFCGLAKSSRKNYNVGTRRWLQFCQNFGIPSPLPALEGDLCLFIAFLARSLKASTIRSYLSGVRSFHVDSGVPDPLEGKEMLHRALRGIKRLHGQAQSKPKLPVTLALLESIAPLINWSSHDEVMIFASWCIATAGLLRSGEFTVFSGNPAPALLNKNLSELRSDGGFLFRNLHLVASKADPFRKGVDIVIGHSASVANALNVFASYDALRSADARHPDAPLFAFSDGKPLTKLVCVSSLRLMVASLGMDASRFAGHSFRRGGAQSLRDAGVPDHLIQVIGRWSSDAYKLYLTTAPRHIAALAQRAAKFTKSPVCIAGPVYSPAI